MDNYNKNIVLENMNIMLTLLGEDANILAIESMTELANKFRVTIKNMAEKVRIFIQKIITWIKEKFAKLLSLNRIKVDEKMWKDSQHILELISNVKYKILGDIIKSSKTEQMEMDHVTPEILEQVKNRIQSQKNKMRNAIDAIKNDKAYHDIESNNYDNRVEIIENGSKLNKQKESIENSIDELKTQLSNLDKGIKSETYPDSPYAILTDIIIYSLNINMELMMMQVSIINKLLSKQLSTKESAATSMKGR